MKVNWDMLLILKLCGRDNHLASLNLSVLICNTGLVNLYKDIEWLIFIKYFINIKALDKSTLESILIRRREYLI